MINITSNIRNSRLAGISLLLLILLVISSLQTNVESEDPKVLVSAQEDLKRVLSLAPNTPLVYYYLGLVVHRTGMVFQNLQLAQSVRAGLNPQLMPMTEVVQLSEEAADWFKKGYEKFPNCSEGLVVYAMVRA